VSESENFLARWSRRKREAEQGASDTPATADPANAAAPPVPAPDAAPTESTQPEASPVDLESLPSIESITADTDIRAFLAPGVPAQLTRAALRRVWETDPSIRDFVGLAENAWDFNAPGGVPGFAPSLPLEEAQRLVAQMLGDSSRPPASASEPPQTPEVTAPPDPAPVASAPPPETSPEQVADAPADQTPADAAVQEEASDERPTTVARLHGGALPR